MRRAEAALKAYDEAIAAATKKAYDKAVAEATAAAWKAFDEAIDKAIAAAWKAFNNEAIDDADDAMAAAWKAFDEAIAPAARKYSNPSITGAKGGRPRSLTLSQIRQQAVASENKEKGGISVEGDIIGTSTATMKKLLKLRIMGRERSTLSPEN